MLNQEWIKKTEAFLKDNDAGCIDRFGVYRIHERLNNDAFLEKPFAEKREYVEQRLSGLLRLREAPVGTKTAGEMWKAKIDFSLEFFQKLADQLKRRESVICC